MALPPLTVRIGADTAALEKGLARAKKNMKAFAVAAGAAAVAVGGAFAVMTTRGLKAIDANAKLARSIGGSVRGLQNLSRAAELAGISQQQLDATLQRMTRRISLAEQESGPASDALAALGLSAKNLNDIDVDQRLDKIVSRVKELVPAAQQAGFFSEIFGDEIGVLIGRLDTDVIRTATQEVTDFGVAVSDEMAAGVEAANDALSRISLVFQGLGNQLASTIAPTLETISTKFTDLARSAQVQDAIQRLVDAFAALADVILSEDFIGAAVSGLEGLANISATAAETAVTLSQNVEMVTVSLSGLAIAAAALGGPIWLVAGALSAALAGIAAWRGKAEDAAAGSKAAAEAQEALNSALGVFHETASPSAAKEAINLANENYKIADSALAAAEAEVAKQKALQAEARGQTKRGARDRVLAAEAELAAAEAAIEAAKVQRDRVAREVTGGPLEITVGGGTQPDPFMEYLDGLRGRLGDCEDGFPAIPGVGGAGAVKDQLSARLEAVQQGLMTEREVINEWYEAGLETLREARERELITEKEFQEQKERLEQEHQARLNAIRDAGADQAFSTVIGTGQEILRAMGSQNEKAMQLAKTLGAFEATVNAYRAASQALADPTLPWWQKLSAAGSLLAAGLSFASSISNMSSSGGSSGGSATAGGGGTSGGGQASTGPAPLQVTLTGLDPNQLYTGSQISGLLDAIQDEAGDRGLKLVTA